MSKLTRREFIAISSLTAGFVIAVQPISANTISTDFKGIVAGEVKIPTKDGVIPAYRARPTLGKDFPVILVVQEIFGVHAYIQDVCRRLAKLGYLAIAPEMFYRQGDVSKLTDIAEIRKVVSKVPDAQVMSDLDATVAWAMKSAKEIQTNWELLVFVGVDELLGFMLLITLKSRLVSHGMADLWANQLHSRPNIQLTSPRAYKCQY